MASVYSCPSQAASYPDWLPAIAGEQLPTTRQLTEQNEGSMVTAGYGGRRLLKLQANILDPYHRERFAAIYRLLADVLEHGPAASSESGHLSFMLGDLTRRVFVGPRVDPPDEMLEQVSQLLRANDPEPFSAMAKRLRAHAEILDQSAEDTSPMSAPDEPGPSLPD